MRFFRSAAMSLIYGFVAVSVVGKSVPLFSSDEPVSIQVIAPLKSLKKQRGDDPQWLEGQVIVKMDNGNETVLDVKLKARGNFRRQVKTCPFPPYWLNFKKSQVKGTVFEGQDSIKVVSHCREKGKPFEAYIYREYLAYKTYNLITDSSFRVRLARIDYKDTQSKYAMEAQAGFFIEHTDVFEDRHKVKQINDRYVLPSLYDLEDLCLAEVFQYFVSNTDFTFFASTDECCHNGKAFHYEDGSRGFLPVPYDFDLSGIVNPPYGRTNPAMMKKGIKKVTQRIYLGIRVPDEILNETLNLYKSKKAGIYALWKNFKPLNEKPRMEALAFIDKFYEVIEDPGKVETEIKKKMRSLEAMDKLFQKRKREVGE